MQEDYFDAVTGAWDMEGLQDDLRLAQATPVSMQVAVFDVCALRLYRLQTADASGERTAHSLEDRMVSFPPFQHLHKSEFPRLPVYLSPSDVAGVYLKRRIHPKLCPLSHSHL